MNTTQGRQTRAWLTAFLLLAAVALIALVPDADARQRCGGMKADIVGTSHRDVIVVPKHGAQVIVSGGGDDRIVAKRNRDFICAGDGDDVIVAGQGRDVVYAGAGNDQVDGGRGGDVIHGEDGDDSIRGDAGADQLYGDTGNDSIDGLTGKDRIQGGDGNDSINSGPGGDTVNGDADDDALQGDAGGDVIHGDSGNDRLYGELQDDHLYGDDGDDLLIGDQGIDNIDGGSGADWMRGGTNQDVYNGGSGPDTVSFATATPPGPTDDLTGVQVDLRKGIVKGDGGEDSVHGTENVLGSPYNDQVIGSGGLVDGLLGNDECTGFGQEQGCQGKSSLSSGEQVLLQGGPDPGFIVVPRKGAADETITLSAGSGGFAVAGSGPFDAGQDCDETGNGVTCASPGGPLGYLVAYGGDGNDSLRIGPGFPGTMTVDLDGGNGDDRLEGNNNNDNLYAGDFGQDVLIGNNGGDALISGVGRDLLDGGPGNDQLVTSDPCSGHVFDGGRGAADVAGFGRTYDNAVDATLGGKAVERGKKNCKPTQISRSNEVLEGTRFADRLVARTNKNLLIGREGNDHCIGGRHKSC